jgi:hypothetical protein
MKKNPPVCPSCGTVFEAESPVRARRGRAAAEKRVVVEAPVAVKVVVEVPVAAAGEEEAEEAVIEDAEELGEDVVEEVVEVEDEA